MPQMVIIGNVNLGWRLFFTHTSAANADDGLAFAAGHPPSNVTEQLSENWTLHFAFSDVFSDQDWQHATHISIYRKE